jgi:hypothetical protein
MSELREHSGEHSSDPVSFHTFNADPYDRRLACARHREDRVKVRIECYDNCPTLTREGKNLDIFGGRVTQLCDMFARP